MTEFIRYMVARAAYYYPRMLPKEIREEKREVGGLAWTCGSHWKTCITDGSFRDP